MFITRQITGTIRRADGTPAAGAVICFAPAKSAPSDGEILEAGEIQVTTSVAGLGGGGGMFSVSLLTDTGGVSYSVRMPNGDLHLFLLLPGLATTLGKLLNGDNT